MTPRATVSAVIFVAAALALVACGGGQPASAPTFTPTTTSTSVSALVVTPTALSVPVPTSAPAPAPTAPSAAALAATPAAPSAPGPTPTSTSAPVPTPAPAPTPMPAAVPQPASTPAPSPTPTPASTQTSTSVSGASYLAEEIPSCTPVPGSSVDPCEPREEGAMITYRLLGRLAGLLFVVPLLYFLCRRAIPRAHIPAYLGIGLLFALQGLVGWLMVKSGLDDRPQVSHLSLTLHLCCALALLAACLWQALGYLSSAAEARPVPPPRAPPLRLAVCRHLPPNRRRWPSR